MSKAKGRVQRLVEDPSQSASAFAQKALVWWIPWLYLLISDSFYLRTYDSAQVKITLVQMGGVCMLALWLCRLIGEGRRAFAKSDLIAMAPFLAYFAYGIFSFWHAPYKYSSTDAFLRRIFYMTVPLIVIREFSQDAIGRLTRILVWTTWLTVGYGFLQWFDITFFSRGVGMGPDPFIWRQAFGERVFSTFGNPNFFADFLVLIFPVLVCQYAKTRDFKLLPLIGMLLWDLIGTQTKGAWVGMGVSVALLSSTYLWFMDRETLGAYWKHIAAAFVVMAAVCTGAIVHKLNNTSWTSVNFRLFTWEATWEMVRTQPLIGSGIGSFWVIYPAFRRPPIFHIEGKHNTETDHSENEWLEVLYDEGILGFGLFLWLVLTTCVIAYRALGQLTGSLKKGQRAPPRAYDLLGYLIALQGMLAHNLFDVSMRFVSSGVYLGLLSGLVVNIARGKSLSELHGPPEPSDEESGAWDAVSRLLIWPARLGALGGLGYAAWLLLTHFQELQGPLFRMTIGGEILQWWIAWIAFAFCVASQGFIFARTALLARNAAIPIVIVLMVFPLKLTWGFFRADVHHNIAIFFSKKQDWENALKNYLIVGKLNPAFVMSFYFKGNVFNDRFNMERIYNPNWGDEEGKPRTDFERALHAYGEVRANAPNYVQMHHQMGALFMKRAQWEEGEAARIEGEGRKEDAARHREESQRFYDLALEHFELYRKHDPVFPANYYRIAQIHVIRKDHAKAIATYQALLKADFCRPAPALIAKELVRKTLLRYMTIQRDDDRWIHRHDTDEIYTHLGNTYFMAGQLPEAADAYRQALLREPTNQHASNNLKVVLNRAHQEGRLRRLEQDPKNKAVPIFEIAPAAPAK